MSLLTIFIERRNIRNKINNKIMIYVKMLAEGTRKFPIKRKILGNLISGRSLFPEGVFLTDQSSKQ